MSDPQALRRALGSFATGVTVVTTCHEDVPFGVTANSFNSVSLDPPLVLWSLANKSASMEAFKAAGHFAVHVLGAHQEGDSARFAKGGAEKFDGVAWEAGVAGSPILPDYCALFECRTVQSYEGGDHVIFVGQVVRFDQREAAPLLFHGGRYAEAKARPTVGADEAVAVEEGRFTRDFLMYLLARAHFQTSALSRPLWKSLGLSEADMLVLSALSLGGPLNRETVMGELAHTGLVVDAGIFGSLMERGLIEEDDGLKLTDAGRDRIVRILAHSKAIEDEIVSALGPAGAADLKDLLAKVIAAVGRSTTDAKRFQA